MTWAEHTEAIIRCRRCPRLVRWREAVARTKTRRFQDEDYWGRPVPGFGTHNARLIIVGLAPAAHGANRTGRMFTGDRSGEWLFEALHTFGFADRPTSVHRRDGLKLHDCFITAACRCAPPDNAPTPAELTACRPFIEQDLRLLRRARIFVGLGKIGFDAIISLLRTTGEPIAPKPRFRHGAEVCIDDRQWVLGSYHPSQQNTFTGRLTRPMFHAIFRRASELLQTSDHP